MSTLDYGFLELAQFKEVPKEQPRSGTRKATPSADQPQGGRSTAVVTTAGLRLNNNEFSPSRKGGG